MLEISHNSMSIAKSCWRKYYWTYHEGLKPTHSSSALSLGQTIHEAFDMFYKGFSSSEVTQYIIDKFDTDIANCSPNDVEDLVIARYTAIGMFSYFPTKDLTDFDKIESEQEFDVPVARGVRLVGKVDGLVEKDGVRWVRELKTTGLHFPQFEKKSRISAQATAYTYAMNKLGKPTTGIIYDYIKKPLLRKRQDEDMNDFGKRIMKDYRERPGMYYRRHYVYRTEQEIKMFEEDMFALVADVKEKRDKKDFYRNTDGCYNFNSECPFYKICHTPNPDPLTLKLYFTKQERKNKCQTKK